MITFCIPSKNNLRYLKGCIKSIQENSFHQNNIFVYVDKDEDGTSKWLEENNISFILNEESEIKLKAYILSKSLELDGILKWQEENDAHNGEDDELK